MSIRNKSKKELKLRSVLQQEIARAEGAESDQIQSSRAAAYKAYYGEPPTDDPDREFEVTSTDVADMINAVLAQLTPMLTTDALVTFEASGKEDEEQARAESDAVQHVIVERSGGYVELQEALKDALLMGNGCVKCYVDTTEEVQKINTIMSDPETGEDIEMEKEQIAALLQPRNSKETRTLDGDAITITTTTRTFKLEAVPIDNISYQSNANTSDIQQFRFFAERLLYTRSDLVEMGYSKSIVDQLPKITEVINTVSNLRNRTAQFPNVATTKDQDTIECYECYIKIDLDGDGVSERYRVLFAGGTYVLDYEPVDFIPYAVGTAIIQQHRLLGESLFERTNQTQRIKTAFLRMWLTNASHVAQGGKLAANPKNVQFSDMSDPDSPFIRIKDETRPPMLITVADAGPSMVAALEYQDKMRTERGGAALDMMSADMQLVGETAHGIERQYSQREMMVSFFANNIAETLIRPAYIIMHELMRRYANEPIGLKLSGEWAEVDPTQWPKRDRCTVKAGMSAGERGHLQRILQQNIQMQLTAMQSGMNGVLADPSTLYNAIYDFNTMAGVDDPDQYFINPKSEASRQAAQANQRAQEQQAQAQQQAQMQLIQAQLELEYAKLAQAAKEAGDKLAFDYWNARMKSEVEEMKLTAQGAFELEKVQMEGEQREKQRLNGAESSASRN